MAPQAWAIWMELEGFFLGQLCASTTNRSGSTSAIVSASSRWMCWTLRMLSIVSETRSFFFGGLVTIVAADVRIRKPAS